MVSSGSTKHRNLFLTAVTGNQGIKLFSHDLIAGDKGGWGVIYLLHQRGQWHKGPYREGAGQLPKMQTWNNIHLIGNGMVKH